MSFRWVEMLCFQKDLARLIEQRAIAETVFRFGGEAADPHIPPNPVGTSDGSNDHEVRGAPTCRHFVQSTSMR